MKITIIGNGSALPAYGRFPTAQVIEINQQLFLIDCGEGTQMRMKQFDIKSMRINHLFISHAHGDHYFGLVGLISSMALLGREKKLYIYFSESHRGDTQARIKCFKEYGYTEIYKNWILESYFFTNLVKYFLCSLQG